MTNGLNKPRPAWSLLALDRKDRFLDHPNTVQPRRSRRAVPEWMRTDDGGPSIEKIKQLVKARFPLDPPNRFCSCAQCPDCDFKRKIGRCLCRNCRHSTAANRCVLALYYVYFQGLTDGQVEKAEGWSPGAVNTIIQQAARFAAGARLDGQPRTGRPRGRPKIQDQVAA